MAGPLLIGLDLGNSSLKCGLYDALGRRRDLRRVAYPTKAVAGGVEQCPLDWFAAAKSGLSALASSAGDDEVAAIGIGGHAPSPVFVDAELRHVAPVLPTLDRRSERAYRRIASLFGAELEPRGQRPMARIAARALWCRDRIPGAFARIRRLLQSGDYLIAQLTGACGFTGRLAPEVLGECGLPVSWLPEREWQPGERAGVLTPATARELGLTAGIPVVAGGLDSFLAAVGSGMITPGDACLNTGSTAVVSLLGEHSAGGRFEWAGQAMASRALGPCTLPPGRALGAHNPAVRLAWRQRCALLRISQGFGQIRRLRVVGGLSRSEEWNQLRANLLGRELECPLERDAGALGAAMLAALGVGVHGDPLSAAGMVEITHVVKPDRTNALWLEARSRDLGIGLP